MSQAASSKHPMDQLVAYVERFVEEVEPFDGESDTMLMVDAAPYLAFQEMLNSYVLGHWDLTEEEVAELWLAGRSLGIPPEHLIIDEALAEAAPGRGQRPSDPPGFRVLVPLLTGGGHGPGRGKPGKREFPVTWSDDEVLRQATDVAQRPSGTVELLSGDFRAYGERLGVTLSVVVSARGELLTAYPVDGDGVVQNPLDEERSDAVRRLQALVDAVPDGPRADLDELMAVGEWPHVVKSLRALALPWSDQQLAELAELAELAGLPRDV